MGAATQRLGHGVTDCHPVQTFRTPTALYGESMSNYTLVVSADPVTDRIRDWIGMYAGDHSSEVREFTIDPRTTLFLIAADVRSLVDDDAGVFFRGYAVDYDAHSICFGLPGYLQSDQQAREAIHAGTEGEYLVARFDSSGVEVGRDLFGIATLAHTSGRGVAAFSDSMLVLSDLRRFLGEPRTQNVEVLLSRSVLNDLAGQQISHETFMEEIHFARIGERFTIEPGVEPAIRSVLPSLRETFQAPDEDYRDVVRTGALRMAGLLRGLATVPEWPVALSLSGGYDSRACLAAATAARVDARMRVNTRNDLAVHADDYRVAQELTHHLGLQLNPTPPVALSPPARSLDCTPLGLWALSSLGIYDYFTFRSSRRSTPQVLGVTGLGAELIKGNFEWQTWQQASGRFELDSPVAKALSVQGERALRDLGCEPESSDATEWHYLAYRNALHGSRHAPIRMAGIAPFQQRELVAMGKSGAVERSRPRRYAPSMVNDLCIVLDPMLSQMAYDKPEKGLSRRFVADRLVALGGTVDVARAREFAVKGHVNTVPSGPSDFAVQLLKRSGLDRTLDSDTVIELSRAGLDLVDSAEVRGVYESVHANAVWRMSTKGLPPVGAGASPAKLPALLGLFR